MNTATVSLAVTPTVVSTFVSHYLNRKPLRQRPTAHLPYDEGLHLIRSFLQFASHHTVEELQAFTSQWVPHPQWVKVEEVMVPEEQLLRAASLVADQLGPEGIHAVGGTKWWQWRKPGSPLRAEWVEMRSDYNQRKRSGDSGKRIMLYVHGGAYFFGSVDEHRYQIQRHARKLKARVIAPRYRLAPQFPFPCGLQDCLATYLHLLDSGHEANTIILAGDSAGGGMVLSVLVTLRDRGIPLPAGAVLISPWVDLTHSFPSVNSASEFDYIPANGFHQKPSEAWPPPSPDQVKEMKSLKVTVQDADKANSNVAQATATVDDETLLSVTIGGNPVQIREQIQMYTTNNLLSHPLVSPIMQPTLGGLPPLFIMTGGGEVLRDEQIYLAHKCAKPIKYMPPESTLDDAARAAIKQYEPTDVLLQVWEDMCHVGPTLSFSRPAKFMYRSVAQFSAWALARAQRTEIEILADDDISVISSPSDSDGEATPGEAARDGQNATPVEKQIGSSPKVGKAGDSLPKFQEHMIRQRVSRHGDIYPLAPASELPGCCVDRESVGVVKEGPVSKWLVTKKKWDTKYSKSAKTVHKKRLEVAAAGYETFGDGENPPPSALVGRRKIGGDLTEKKKSRSMGLSLWSLWGSKHDEMTVTREEQAGKAETKAPRPDEGAGAPKFSEIQKQEPASSVRQGTADSSQNGQVEGEQSGQLASKNTPVAELIAHRREKEKSHEAEAAAEPGLLAVPETGATGKRPVVDGICVPFTLKKEAETASMVTLTSVMEPGQTSRPMSLDVNAAQAQEDGPKTETELGEKAAHTGDYDATHKADKTLHTPALLDAVTPLSPLSPSVFETPLTSPNVEGRPPLEKFVTADEDLLKAHSG